MSINNDNIVKIGVALKWRNTFDLTKKYYQENVVTACGCVFRCKVLQAQGKSPIKMTDDQGHIVYTNTDVWDVLVDMAYYYNYAVDTRKLTQQMLDYAKKLDEAFQKQQKEIEALQKDNRDQWNHINDIEKVNTEQQRELNSIFDTISCFSEGIWIDTLLWSNETIWDNNKYAITDDLQNQIDVLSETHRQDIKDLTDKHDSEISALTANIVRQNKIQDGINTYLQDQVYDLNTSFCCFGTGVWENDLHWSQEALWDNNKYAITDALAEDIKKLDEHLSKSDQAFKDAMLANSREHGLVNTHLQKHDREINDLQILIQEHDQQIIDLINTLACFSNGYWDDGLKWSNVALWENSNLMYDSFEDIYRQIENHQRAISDLTKEIQKVKSDAEATMESINKTFAGFRKEHEDFRKEHEEFGKEHENFRKEHQAITGRLNKLDTQCEGQQHEIDSLLYHISILTNGVWDNNLLWVNESEWNNTDLNGTCHCPEDTEERLDELQEGFEAITQRVSGTEENIEAITSDVEANSSAIQTNASAIANNASEIETIKQNAITEHRSVAYQLRAIGREQATQDENIAKLGEHFSCYADGIWGDLFIWDNELLWANETGVVNEAISDLRNDLRDTRSKLNEANEDIMTNLSLIRANHQLIENNTVDIQENKEAIETTQSELQSTTDAIRKEALTEHRQVAYQLRAIGREQTAQDENIAKLGEHFNCFADGIWGDIFLWDNDRLWANASGVIETAIDDIHVELDCHQNTLDFIIEEKNEHFTCFSDDVWCNSSVWDNGRLWPSDFSNFAQAIQKNQNDIEAANQSVESLKSQTEEEVVTINNNISQISENVSEISTSIQSQQELIEENFQQINNNTENIQKLNESVSTIQIEAITEHRNVAYQLRAIAREQAIQDDNVSKLGEHFECFVDGVWGDLFLWNNDHLWHNESGVIEEALADTNERIDKINEEIEAINQRAEEHQSEYQKMLDDIRAYNGCFEKGEWANPFFWNDTDVWYNTPNSISETENDIISHDNRLTTLESQFALFIQQFAAQQTIIEQHQSQLETLMDCFTVLNVGKWQNLLLWDNTSKWSNALITEATASVGTGGDSTVTVKSYDPDTATVTI